MSITAKADSKIQELYVKAFWQKVKTIGNNFFPTPLIPLKKSTSVLHSQLQAHIKASRLRVGKKNPWVM
jgi:hypothetical protein